MSQVWVVLNILKLASNASFWHVPSAESLGAFSLKTWLPCVPKFSENFPTPLGLNLGFFPWDFLAIPASSAAVERAFSLTKLCQNDVIHRLSAAQCLEIEMLVKVNRDLVNTLLPDVSYKLAVSCFCAA